MSPALAVVQGASGGVGRQLVSTLLKQTPFHIIATCRNPSAHQPTYSALTKEDLERITVLPLDVTKEETIFDAAEVIRSRFGKGSIRLLINSSGILHPEKALKDIDPERALDMYRVNALGPILVAKHMVPYFAKSGSTSTLFSNPVIASLSARVGSIGDNRIGGWYNYRASKAALNQLHKTMAVNLAGRGIISVVLHPGTVETDLSRKYLGGYDKKNVLTAEKSSGLLMEVMKGLRVEDSGRFLDYAGNAVEW